MQPSSRKRVSTDDSAKKNWIQMVLHMMRIDIYYFLGIVSKICIVILEAIFQNLLNHFSISLLV